MWLTKIFSIDHYDIQVYNNKNIQLFSQNLVNVSLKGSRSIRKAKKHDLVFEVAILGLESSFSVITFTNPHLMIGICQI